MRRAAKAVAAAGGIAVLLGAAPAVAAGSPVLDDYILKWQDDAKVDCKKPQTTYEIDVCAGRDYKKDYAALAALYGRLYAKYDAANRKALEASQRAWNTYQAAECDYETETTAGGTIHSTMVTMCDATLALERIKRLKAQADCSEGDLSCNHP
ncbi:MAG TPA: lysozyme inhibitor LprI family protein [Rhizomicrobium sp.]|jgi:uncharacterized protein YecT (DUF1311 family)|nr:lysozyme inhibitor LprI family protein [Rhizomicrobium sp.]